MVTMENSLLIRNDLKRIHISTPLLFAFSISQAVMMGILFYSGQTLSLSGRAPLPVIMGNVSPLIAAAYILSIVFVYFFPQYSVRFLRCFAVIELCSALILSLPLPDHIFTTVYLFYCFIFVAPTVQATALVTWMFREETTTRFVTLGYGMGFFIAALLQNEVFPVPFSVFQLFMIFSAAATCFFFHKMPVGAWPNFAAKGDGLTCPRRFFVLVYALFTIGGLMNLFGGVIAEAVPHGTSVFYGTLAVSLALVYVIWKRFGIPVLRIGSVGVGIGILGYILALVSLNVPTLAMSACIVLGVGSVVCWLTLLFTVTLAKLYPARSLTPVMILLGLGTILLHSSLVEAFRDNIYFLYVVYLVIAVGMGVLYLVLEPYLTFTLREKTPRSLSSSTSNTHQPEVTGTEARQGLAAVLQTHAFNKLTGQELRTAELILRGYSYTEIAKALDVKPGTVKTHWLSIYSKLQINSKRELFAIAEKV
jgi:DNA-binding CsgD family transcriptional regulator